VPSGLRGYLWSYGRAAAQPLIISSRPHRGGRDGRGQMTLECLECAVPPKTKAPSCISDAYKESLLLPRLAGTYLPGEPNGGCILPAPGCAIPRPVKNRSPSPSPSSSSAFLEPMLIYRLQRAYDKTRLTICRNKHVRLVRSRQSPASCNARLTGRKSLRSTARFIRHLMARVVAALFDSRLDRAHILTRRAGPVCLLSR